MSNFTILKTGCPELYETVREAEQNVNSAPRTSCFYVRRSLERAVKWLYANDSYLKQPYADNLAVHSDKPISIPQHPQRTLPRPLRAGSQLFSVSTSNRQTALRHHSHSAEGQRVADRNAEQLAKDARLAAKDAELARTIEEIAALKARIQEYKERNSQPPDDYDYSEAETKDYFIDLLLKE